jgi:RimJ/RimL family protein N-acetyltransferase
VHHRFAGRLSLSRVVSHLHTVALSINDFETARLRLRQWRESDREPFAAMNADPAVMEFFPSVLTRASSDASIDAWQSQFAAQGWSNWAAELIATGEFIGFIGLSVPRRVVPFSPCVEIGWRLARAYWGRGLATEAARGALRIGFVRIGLDEIVSFTAAGNHRSRAVMERIGMHNAHEDFEHPGVPEGNPLRLHCLYRLRHSQWKSTLTMVP